MGSTIYIQGQGEGSREQLVLVPISEGIPQDILESFGVQEDLHLALELEQSTQLYSVEMREFLPAHLGDWDWSSRERSCQEIGLVALMFFFELLFSYVSSSISFYVFFY